MYCALTCTDSENRLVTFIEGVCVGELHEEGVPLLFCVTSKYSPPLLCFIVPLPSFFAYFIGYHYMIKSAYEMAGIPIDLLEVAFSDDKFGGPSAKKAFPWVVFFLDRWHLLER